MILLTAKGEQDDRIAGLRSGADDYVVKPFSRNQLLDRVWEPAFQGDTGTVTVHIRRLRAKIEPDPERPRFIQTVWGVGYRFET